MGPQTTWLFPLSAAVATGCVSLALLRIKPVLLSTSLSDFSGVTAGKALLFITTLAGLFWGVSTIEQTATGQLRWSLLLYLLTLSAWIDLERRIIPNGLIIVGLISSMGFFFMSGNQL